MKQGKYHKLDAALIAVLILLTACSVAPYKPAPLNVDALRQRAEVQSFEPLTVKAAVPSAEESKVLFGVPLYDNGVQPVWLEITNGGDENVRFALVSVDPDYFSPLEVSYTLRKGFSKEARAAMDKRFHNSGITRFVESGETVSGFVFTHLSPGTKSFNVDLFGVETMQNFAFFIQVPGFKPDHAEIDFKQLYTRDETRELTTEEFRDSMGELSIYTANKDAEPSGLPVNVVIVGNGIDVLRALLRAGWYESIAASSDKTGSGQETYYLYGRKPDAVFRFQRKNSVDRNELRVWLAPMRVDGEMVWLGQVTNFVGQRSYIEQVFYGAHLDPDVDDARSFLLQNIWYAQGLQSFAWSNAGKSIPFDQPGTDFNGNPFFTDGFRTVLWFSGAPYSLLDTTPLNWDEVPGQ
ncbi:MAG: LssY C-terminal domain-containing protein [Xanthomonadales bacterium]|nr:LssY C-terminal domain-containing protein [Xanthomonadales bacterium]